MTILACRTVPTANYSPAALQSELESRTLQYFIEQANPKSGLVRDRAENFVETPADNRIASTAATGFGMAVIANAAKRGQVPREFARHYVLKTLKFAKAHIGRHKGWMYHFIDWETGAAVFHSEYSTIDTALFVAGGLYADQVLGDREIHSVAYDLYRDLDFKDMLTDGGKQPKKKTLSMAYWDDGSTYRQAQWDVYAEQMLLVLLGLGHPTSPLPADTWLAWDRKTRPLPSGAQIMGMEGALFVHQYSQIFVDFRAFQDGFANYFANSALTSQWQREMIHQEPHNATLAAGFWGFSAGEAPGRQYVVWDGTHYGTIACVGCAVASVMFMPEPVFKDMHAWRQGPYAAKLWGRYGFTDSVDIASQWFSPTVLGITVGPEYLALANTQASTSVWSDFMKIPSIQTAMARAAGAARPLAGVE